MSAGAVWALQRHVIAALRADTALKAALGDPVRAYDTVPGEAVLPYLCFGDWQYTDAGTDDAAATRHQFTIEVWTDYAGRKRSLEIAVAVEAALNGLGAAMDGHHLIDLRHTGGQFIRQDSERLSLGLMRFVALTQPSL